MANSFSTRCIALLAFLPGILLFGRCLGRRATGDASLARWIAPGLAGASWLLVVHVIGLSAESFGIGLWTGTIAVGVVGVIWRVLEERQILEPERPPSTWIWLGMVLAACTLFPTEFSFQRMTFDTCSPNDECWVTGHFSIPNQILNNVYPPHHLTFGQFELRYHYGIDTLCAMTSALLRLSVPTSLHLLTLALWSYSFGLLWVFGERLLGRRAGPLMGCALFSGGIPFICIGQPSLLLLPERLKGVCRINGIPPTMPLVSSFLQHPWTAGIPLALIAILLVHQEGSGLIVWRHIALMIVMSTLSLCEIVLFVTLVPAAFLQESFVHFRPDPKRSVAAVATFGATLLIAVNLHGFFASPLEPTGNGLVYSPFWVGPLPALVLWHVQSLGVLLPLGIIGWLRLKGPRLLFGLLSVGPLVVFDLVRYRYSLDVMKFVIVTQLALGILAAVALYPLLVRRLAWPVAVLGALAMICASLAWEYAVGAHLDQTSKKYDWRSIGEDDVQAISWLRKRIGPGESVFRSSGSQYYSVLGGLPQLEDDGATDSFGFSAHLWGLRRALLSYPSGPERYLEQGVRWFVLERDGDWRINQIAARWIADGRANVVATFGALRLLYLTDK